ncbi:MULTISPECIES: F0F1 ATP synthase subunit epsilon [unclassified Paracoccus (in: a-proteobacteria)]|uniref:F0F1 ATP synthase subunit epsilon n=1 Tax=unclassified Paracoccus (in: a-proteobacteria) TaxID=2688777 RepID=UPI0016038B92|nr:MULTISPECIES: F0F1 ATP synthase subunit epsilon [unclassified Paracoccus (in: a-proteobacteria)]MBB1491894.1 F0F1 ATP synthase subunit epsilon [Paracoccus sp. MC1854]MBB1498243.1 F0F1 ATP synthase subunit epsilon [Paracoccus sp. MC1862]QQO45731.1 F0F1 ATP synthase subunit epsilon [Paracoccus sp. MC1862]
MADTMQFDLVSPERRLVSIPVREVRLPGTDGDLTAMPGHAATMVTLRPGLVTVVDAQGTATEFAVTGGFAEINGESVSLLAERGHARAEITQDVYNEMMRDAQRSHQGVEARRESVGDEMVAASAKMLGDMQALGTHIGLDPNQSTVPD